MNPVKSTAGASQQWHPNTNKSMRRFIPTRRPFRFSLLGLLVVVTLAAGAAGWMAYQLAWMRQRREVVRRDGNELHFFPAGWYMPEAPWPIRWFGEQGRAGIILVHRDPQRAALLGTGTGIAKDAESLLTAAEQRELEQVRALFPEASVAARFE